MTNAFRMMAVACAAAFTAGAASADGHISQPSLSGPKIYAYETHANYCPAGLQPVTINGVICCGTPNAGITYQQAMSHPVKRTYRTYTRRLNCPPGVKGCY